MGMTREQMGIFERNIEEILKKQEGLNRKMSDVGVWGGVRVGRTSRKEKLK